MTDSMTLKEQYIDKKKKLKQDILDLMYEFETETGVIVTNIITDIRFDILTFDIMTDIERE
jgi:hypothetical protein